MRSTTDVRVENRHMNPAAALAPDDTGAAAQHLHTDHGRGSNAADVDAPGRDRAQVAIIPRCGEMAEWSMAVVLKCSTRFSQNSRFSA